MGFIYSQIMGAIALILACCGYFFKSKKNFLLLHLISNVFYALSFIFVNKFVAGIGSFISIFRVVLFFIYEKTNKKVPLYIIFLFFAFYLINGIILFKEPLDIIPIITSTMFTFAMWIRDVQIVRFLMFPPNILIAIYAILSRAYVTAVLDFLEAFIIIISILTTIYKNKKIQNNDNLNIDLEEKNNE